MGIKYNNGVVYLTPEFAHFEKNGDFLALRLEGELSRLCENALDVERLAYYDRVKLRRAFPFSLDSRYISVLDTEQNEIGLIEDIEIFGEKERELIKSELERVYFTPKIKTIKSVKDRVGFTYFDVVCDVGEREIPVKDVYKSLLRIGEDKIVLMDADGNRYYIEEISKLDKNSKKKLELYI